MLIPDMSMERGNGTRGEIAGRLGAA